MNKTTRPFMVTVDTVMKLYEEYMNANSGYTTGVGGFVANKMNIKLSSVFAYRYYGTFLKDHGIYDRALAERWGMKKIVELMSKFKKSGTTVLSLVITYYIVIINIFQKFLHGRIC